MTAKFAEAEAFVIPSTCVPWIKFQDLLEAADGLLIAFRFVKTVAFFEPGISFVFLSHGKLSIAEDFHSTDSFYGSLSLTGGDVYIIA